MSLCYSRSLCSSISSDLSSHLIYISVIKMLSITAMNTLSLYRLYSPILSNLSFWANLYISTMKALFFSTIIFFEATERNYNITNINVLSYKCMLNKTLFLQLPFNPFSTQWLLMTVFLFMLDKYNITIVIYSLIWT